MAEALSQEQDYSYPFIEIFEEEYDQDVAEAVEDFYADGSAKPLEGPERVRYERARSFLPGLMPERFSVEEFEDERLNDIASLRNVHSPADYIWNAEIDSGLYSQLPGEKMPPEPEEVPEDLLLSYQVIDSLVADLPLHAEIAETEAVRPDSMLHSLERAERGGKNIVTPGHVDRYIYEQHGKGYRGFGKVLDKFDDMPDMEDFGFPTRREIAEAARAEEAAVVTGNEAFNNDPDTVVLTPDVLEKTF